MPGPANGAGSYGSSEFVETNWDFWGAYVAAFGIRLRSERDVMNFRRRMIKTMRIGRKFRNKLRSSRSDLV